VYKAVRGRTVASEALCGQCSCRKSYIPLILARERQLTKDGPLKPLKVSLCPLERRRCSQTFDRCMYKENMSTAVGRPPPPNSPSAGGGHHSRPERRSTCCLLSAGEANTENTWLSCSQRSLSGGADGARHTSSISHAETHSHSHRRVTATWPCAAPLPSP